MERISRHKLMRGAMLRDLMDRIDASIERYETLVLEEEESRQAYNEDAAEFNDRLDKELESLRGGRSTIEGDQDEIVASARKNLADARMELANQLALHNLPVPIRNWGVGDDPDVIAKSPALSLDSATQIAGSETALALPAGNEIRAGAAGWLDRLRSARFGAPPPSTNAFPTEPIITTNDGTGASEGASFSYPQPEMVKVAFPFDEGKQLARPMQVVAIDSGLPSGTPSESIFAGANKWLIGIVTAACGLIFGASVGILLGLVKPSVIAVGGASQTLLLIAFGLFGAAIFFGMGKTIQGLASLAAEDLYASLLARNNDDPESAGRWFRIASIAMGAVGAIAIISLIAVESTVERYGIVKLFVDSTINQAILTGRATQQPPGPLAVTMLTLIASAPFALLHATEGWIQAKAKLFHYRLMSGSDRDAWVKATKLHSDRVDRAQSNADTAFNISVEQFTEMIQADKLAAESRQGEREELAARAASVAQESAKHSADSSLGSEKSGHGPDDTIEGEFDAVADEDIDGPEAPAEPRSTSTPDFIFDERLGMWARRSQLALANERAREAYARLRETYARRRDALQWHDQRISALESSRRQERAEPTSDGRRRIEDAYSDLIGAVGIFDAMYARESKAFERWASGGIIWQIAGWFGRRPAE